MRRLLRRDLTAALEARDREAVAALRPAIAAIENAEAVDVHSPLPPESASRYVAGATAGLRSADVEPRLLGEADEQPIVRARVDERAAAACGYERLGRSDVADRLRREAEVLSAYLA